jgi:hypothetical protein
VHFLEKSGLGRITVGFLSVNHHETKFDLVWINRSILSINRQFTKTGGGGFLAPTAW